MQAHSAERNNVSEFYKRKKSLHFKLLSICIYANMDHAPECEPISPISSPAGSWLIQISMESAFAYLGALKLQENEITSPIQMHIIMPANGLMIE